MVDCVQGMGYGNVLDLLWYSIAPTLYKTILYPKTLYRIIQNEFDFRAFYTILLFMQNLSSFLRENKKTVVCGLEGSSKTRSIIDHLINEIDFNSGHYAVMAFKSYKLMKEKQLEIIDKYGLSENEVPIVARFFDHKYSEYYTNKTSPNLATKNAKIVLMSQRALCMCHFMYTRFSTDELNSSAGKLLKWIVVDEFDPVIGVIPSLHYIKQSYSESVIDGKITKKSFLHFLRNEYSNEDYYAIKELGLSASDSFNVASWIDYCSRSGISITFSTSEILARMMLESIGFSSMVVGWKDFSSHAVNLHKTEVNSFLFDRLNSQNKWGVFGFKFVISDRCNPDIIHPSTVDVNVINHMSVRGTNSLAGNRVLTLLSNVPNSVIKKIVDTLNHFYKSQEFEFDKVKRIYHRDRLCQAVGRVIGYRGEWKGVSETWVIANDDIVDLLSFDSDDEMLEFPYSVKMWDFKNNEFKRMIENVTSDKRIKREVSSAASIERRKKFNDAFNSFLDENFSVDSGSRLRYADVKRITDAFPLKELGGTNPSKVANYFGLKVRSSSEKINGKPTPYQFIDGLKIKRKEME